MGDIKYNGSIKRNDTVYQQIQELNGTLDKVVEQLRQLNSNVCYEFNGHMLFSDMTVDEAYLEVLGLDKDSYDRMMQIEADAKRHASKEDIDRFNATLSLGDSVIPEQFRISLHGMACESLKQGYGCKEFDCTFAVIEALEDGVSLQEVAVLMDEYGLTDLEKNFVAWEVQELSTRGDSFHEYVINNIDIEQSGPIIGDN